jgi:hypothetical protein
MFQSVFTNIKRKFSKPTDEVVDNKETTKTGFKRSLHVLKTKLLKTEVMPLSVNYGDGVYNTALSPRAFGTAECAKTEIEWPSLTDTNPNILDKFTRIVTIPCNANDDTVRFYFNK